jgi:hypothetical protein
MHVYTCIDLCVYVKQLSANARAISLSLVNILTSNSLEPLLLLCFCVGVYSQPCS